MDYELIEPDEQDAYDPAPFLSYARLRSQDKQERDPLIGDTVHHWDGFRCVAALVTADHLRAFDLTSFPPDGPHSVQRLAGVAHDEGDRAPDTWHWPCGGH